MKRKGRNKNILEMALKTAGIKKIKCRKSLMPDFEKCNPEKGDKKKPGIIILQNEVIVKGKTSENENVTFASNVENGQMSRDTNNGSQVAHTIPDFEPSIEIISESPSIIKESLKNSSQLQAKPEGTSRSPSVNDIDNTSNVPLAIESPHNTPGDQIISEPTDISTSRLSHVTTHSNNDDSASVKTKLKDQSKIPRVSKNVNYLDYMSDDEITLLNAFGEADSSDEWEPANGGKKKKKLSSMNTEEEVVGETATKRNRMNKRKLTSMARSSGKSYVKANGNVSEEKQVKPNPCIGKKCGNNCEVITEERRKSIFDHFWSLTEQRKKDWLVGLTKKVPVKRKRSKDSEKRQLTFIYHITEGESHRAVCLQFLCQTLDVSHKYVYYTVSNADEFGSAKVSMRGKNIPPNKTSDDRIIVVENFIKSLPAVPSHYCRKDSTRVYLPSELKNLANLYRVYKNQSISQGTEHVSETIFRKIFTEKFNIAFHIPKKDKCLKCCQYENKTEPTQEDKIVFEQHLIEKDHTYERYKMHKNIHLTDPETLCASFDLQKVLNTPYGESMLLFYSRKLAVYNVVVYENGTRNVYCFYWDESQGKRGANEMATILSKYIEMVDQRGNIKRLLLYCDCCPGQNRNKIVLAAIHDCLQRCKSIQSIQINFLLTGHTYMTVDSAHATKENSIKNIIIWAPSQWFTVFQTARKHPVAFNVQRLSYEDFKRWDIVGEKYFVGNLVGKISKVRVATFKKTRTEVTFKYSMAPESPVVSVQVALKTKLVELPNCYGNALPISEKKYNDLMKLCSDKVIPVHFQSEYQSLTYNKQIQDILAESDIEDNTD